ncbi:hypothetical protein [Fibrobacter sp. UWB3]|uniref:hypothetical protein n=1 Tax=Fibrobacter sp. UWB3 TaxID=1964357 RepID=UPI000B51FB04|nr:hypothetical protein [Fibrobacter sp. UWB3]OWV15687.1 hypothetical protein B7991_14505 [Fibrobacter sp. UWB3]
MKFRDLFEKWHLDSLKLNIKFLEAEFKPGDKDKDAAWALYIELLTRVTTQTLSDDEGNEECALDSIYSIFPTTRAILKEYGRECIQFTKVAVVVLNQIVRPFTAKWHKIKLNGLLAEKSAEFRMDLKELQPKLLYYTKMLSEIAEVEDFSGLVNPMVD